MKESEVFRKQNKKRGEKDRKQDEQEVGEHEVLRHGNRKKWKEGEWE